MNFIAVLLARRAGGGCPVPRLLALVARGTCAVIGPTPVGETAYAADVIRSLRALAGVVEAY